PEPVDYSKKNVSDILGTSPKNDFLQPMLKKNHGGRYDLSTSLSAAYNNSHSAQKYDRFNSNFSRSFSYGYSSQNFDSADPDTKNHYQPNEYTNTYMQPSPGYHAELYASSPKYKNFYLSN